MVGKLSLYKSDRGLLLYLTYRAAADKTASKGRWANLPCSLSKHYASGVCPMIKPGQWIDLVVRFKASGERLGGAEIWLNGERIVSDLYNHNTPTRMVDKVSFGFTRATGQVLVDGVTISDSLILKPAAR